MSQNQQKIKNIIIQGKCIKQETNFRKNITEEPKELITIGNREINEAEVELTIEYVERQ